jgi:hypothetical protein
MRERRVAYRASVGKPEGRRPLGRTRRRWEDNIKKNIKSIKTTIHVSSPSSQCNNT